MSDTQTEPRTRSFAELFGRITRNMTRVIRGKPDSVHLAALTLVCEGHLLVEDAPGVGKTTLAKALARSVDVDFGRVQFTPDLLPSDVVGVTVWHRGRDEFEFHPGPVFNGVVLADEINRASPKTQSALLEAMAERQVTVDGTTYQLARPFLVIATQNPLDHEGTYPLPESQLDRFLMRLHLGYPAPEAELEILNGAGGDLLADLEPVVSIGDVKGLIAAATQVHCAPEIQRYLVDLANATRRHGSISLGISPRATLALQRVVRAHAASQGRDYVTPDDVKALARPVLTHRLHLTAEAELRGMQPDKVLDEILHAVPAPHPGIR